MIMAANVSNVIIPGQQRMVEAVRAGREPDPKYGAIGKQRSVHNTYFTLPVVFAMLANHYAWPSPSPCLAGAGRDDARRRPDPRLVRDAAQAQGQVVGARGRLLFMTAARRSWRRKRKRKSWETRLLFTDVMHVIDARCVTCHAEKPAFHASRKRLKA